MTFVFTETNAVSKVDFRYSSPVEPSSRFAVRGSLSQSAAAATTLELSLSKVCVFLMLFPT